MSAQLRDARRQGAVVLHDASAERGRVLLAQGDWVRLQSLAATRIGHAYPAITAFLRGRLVAADVVRDERLPSDVVSMGARVGYRGVGWSSASCDEIELVYPWDSAPELGRVSVFSPLGAALLGARVGDVCSWTSPRGRRFEWVVCGVRARPRSPAPSRMTA